jgi:hypothetical protein
VEHFGDWPSLSTRGFDVSDFLSLAFGFVAFGTLFALIAAIPFWVTEKRWRWRWQEVQAGLLPVDAHANAFRDGGATVPTFHRSAPTRLRWAAYSCIFFGQMFVPGLIAGVFGLLALGIGVVSIPGLITAAKLYGTGFALLRRDPRGGALWSAESAAAWGIWLNGVIAAISVPIIVYSIGGRHWETFWLCMFFDGYGALSIAQALFLRHTVRRYRAELLQSSVPAPVAPPLSSAA